MVERLHRGLGSLIWRTMIASIILLAVYVTGTRALLQALPELRQQLVVELSQRFGADIRVGQLDGDVVGFAPQISLEDVHVTLPGEAGLVIDLSGATFTLDPWASLIDLEPRLDSLRLEGSSVSINVGDYGGDDEDADLSILGDLLRVFRKVTVAESRIELTGKNGARLAFALGIELRRDGSQRQFRVRLSENAQNYFAFEGSGVGNLLDPGNFSGEIHGELRSHQVGEIARLFSDWDIGGSADIDFWYRVQNGRPALTLSVAMGDVLVRNAAQETLFSLNAAATQALLRPTDQGWLATLANVGVESDSAGFGIERLQLETRGQSLRFALADVNVADAVQVLLSTGVLTGEARDIVATLAPSGQLVSLQARVENLADPLMAWSAAAQVIDATTQPAFDVPGLYGIDATVEATQDGATAWIDTRDFGLDLRGIYNETIRFETVEGSLSARWRSDALFLEHGVLSASAGNHDAKVQFGIDIPFTDDASLLDPLAMYLDVGLSEAPVSIRSHYVPAIIPAELYDWLDTAIIDGSINTGAFVWRGGFDDFGEGSQSMQLGLSLTDGTLKFEPDWPEVEQLNAELLVDTDRVSVWGRQGAISGLSLADVSVELDGDSRVHALHIEGAGAGKAADALQLLRNSPVAELAGSFLADLDVTGQVSGQVNLELDLDAFNAEPGVKVALTLDDASLQSESLELRVEGLDGDLSFDLSRGFSSRALTASLFGQPVDVSIAPGTTGLPDAGIFDARFVGQVPAADGVAWIGQVSSLDTPDTPFSLAAEGIALVTVDVAVGQSARIRVSSDLEGLALDLPAPIGKTAEQRAPFLLELEAGDAPWDAFWYRRLQGRFYRHDGQFVGATIDITPRWRRSVLKDSPMTEDIYISGRLPQLEVEPWLAVWDQINLPVQERDQSTPVIIERVGVQSVIFGGVDVGPVNIDLTPFDTWDMLGVNADWLDAELTLRQDGLPSSLIINNLDLNLLPDLVGKKSVAEVAPESLGIDSVDSGAPSDPDSARPVDDEVGNESAEEIMPVLAEPEPPELTAPLVVVIANVRYHDSDLGAATFTVTSGDGVLEANDIRGNLADIGLGEGSRLVWQRADTGEFNTTLYLNSEIENLGKTFAALDIEPAVETRSGRVVADLSWPGGPADIDLMALSGNVDIRLREGSFLPLPAGATGFVRILSVLNLAGLFERANVTRLFEPGVAFKKAEGKMQFQPGKIVIPDFVVDGPGGGFRIDTDIDLIGETLDGELIVTLPLAENIPWVAALAGGIPVAAGVYLVSKVFEDQVKSLSSGVYSVTGPIAQPEVKFVRVFDATSNKVREDTDPGAGADPAAQSSTSSPAGSSNESGETSSEGSDDSSSSRR